MIEVIKCLGSDLGIDPSSIEYCIQRYKNEGIKFLTVTLPKLEKALYESLEKGFFIRENLTCFAWSGRLLREFRLSLGRIFTRSGKVKQKPDLEAIRGLVQFSGYFYKLTDPAQKGDVRGFRLNDEAVLKQISNEAFHGDDYSTRKFTGFLHVEWNNLLRRLPKDFSGILKDCPPRDGPGSFSIDGVEYSSRSAKGFYQTERIRIGPAVKRGYKAVVPFLRESHVKRAVKEVADTSNVSELLFVPKDSRGPRTIVREPLLNLRMQMSTFDYMSRFLERNSRRRINFEDQTVNQELARQSSVTGEYCTIDLKDASDMISYPIVMRLFESHPALRWFLIHCRTTHVDLYSSLISRAAIVGLSKVAGMGSGLTFWILSSLVWASTVASIRFHKPSLSPHYIRDNVYTYGDDLVTRTEWYDYAAKGLNSVGLKLNMQKSFKGRSHVIFRESCGVNCVNGYDVTPVRLKLTGNKLELDHKWNVKRALLSSEDILLLQLERHCRELVKNKLNSLAEHYYSIIESHMRRRFKRKNYKLPRGGHNFPGLCRWTFMSNHFDVIDHPTVTGEYPLIKAFVPVAETLEVPFNDGGMAYSRKLYELARREYDPLAYLTEGSVGLSEDTVSLQRRVKFAWLATSSITCDATLVDT